MFLKRSYFLRFGTFLDFYSHKPTQSFTSGFKIRSGNQVIDIARALDINTEHSM